MSTPGHSSDAKEFCGGAYRLPPPPRPASGVVILASDHLSGDAPAMDEPPRPEPSAHDNLSDRDR